jgi:hypothetical protein
VSHLSEVSVYENCKEESELRERETLMVGENSSPNSVAKKSGLKKPKKEAGSESKSPYLSLLVQSPLVISNQSTKTYKHDIKFEEETRMPCCHKKFKCIIF